MTTTTTIIMKTLIYCYNCGHVWKTKSKLRYVTCPNCLRKTEFKKVKGGRNEEKKN